MKVSATQYNLSTALNKTAGAEQPRPTVQENAAIKRPPAIDPLLGEAQSNLGALPEVDLARVAEMREAIGSGKIAIDLDALTSAMQKYFQR